MFKSQVLELGQLARQQSLDPSLALRIGRLEGCECVLAFGAAVNRLLELGDDCGRPVRLKSA
jgi:hypothetical protein